MEENCFSMMLLVSDSVYLKLVLYYKKHRYVDNYNVLVFLFMS